MRYSNPKIPEGINTSQEHPLKEFFILTAGALAILLLLAALLGYFGGSVARLIPFEMEREWSQKFSKASDTRGELEQYLDALAGRVAKSMDLDDKFHITLHYSTDSTINAFATLGGNIIMFKGLLERLPDEDALAMLVAHEMAHIKHRDPIVSFGSSITIQAGLAILLGNSDASVLGNAGLFTILHFSREMESDADAQAVKVLVDLYGHIGGATELFSLFGEIRKAKGMSEQPAIFSSHPLDNKRLDTMMDLAKKEGWPVDGERTALPSKFAQWLKASVDDGGSE